MKLLFRDPGLDPPATLDLKMESRHVNIEMNGASRHSWAICLKHLGLVRVWKIIIIGLSAVCVSQHIAECMYRSGSGFGCQIYKAVYGIILFLVMQYVLPMMLLIILNAKVVVTLRRATTHRANTLRIQSRRSLSQSSRSAVTPSMFESTRRVTLVVVIVVLLCTVCHLVAMVAHVLWSLEVACRRHFTRASNVILTVNSAANFIIYCMCSRNFRAVLVNCCFSCCRRINRNSQAVVDVGDDRNDGLLVSRGRRHVVAIGAPQSSSSSRRNMTNERLLQQPHQAVDIGCSDGAGDDNNDVEMHLITTDCISIPVRACERSGSGSERTYRSTLLWLLNFSLSAHMF